MTSPLQQRRARIASVALSQSVLTQTGDGMPTPALTNKSEWDVVRASIAKDKRALKGIKQIREKLEYKQRNLEQYAQVLSRSDVPSDIATALMVWLFDCGDMPRAVPLGLTCVQHGFAMPDGFKSDVATFMADSVLEWAQVQWRLGQATGPYFNNMLHLVVNEWNLFEQIEAKYLKLAGLMTLGTHTQKVRLVSEPERLYAAKALFEEALKCYSKVGVNVRIEEIDKRLTKLNLPLQVLAE
ncbi:phage terminase small subunit [Shewanella baltica]|uniref:phage terminase small subunit n=1 Tax=Shewanella baltica TaxID=62322 RepID=UPI003D090A7C